MNKLTIVTHAWNESLMLPYWFRHYRAMGADRLIVFFDTETNDGSDVMARQLGAEVRPSPIIGLNDQEFVDWANEEYRKFRGQTEWLIWVDCDEMVYHSDLIGRLDYHMKLDHKILQMPVCWQMAYDKFPMTNGQIYDEVTQGCPDGNRVVNGMARGGKPVIIRPEVDIQWAAGKHWNFGEKPVMDDEMLFMHFRCLGLDWLLSRNHRNWARINERNRKLNHGAHVNPACDVEQTGMYETGMKMLQTIPIRRK